MIEVLHDDAAVGNPSSVHVCGQRARRYVEQARRSIARAVGARPLDVVFTASGTEADNLAVLGGVRALGAKTGRCAIVTSPLEHPAVSSAVERLARAGHPRFIVPVDACGRITVDALADVLRTARGVSGYAERVGMVTLAAGNHEIGNVYDIPEFVAVIRDLAPHALIHCDAVQVLGKRAIDMRAWGVDLLSINAHKAYGPSGVGALIVRPGVEIEPLLVGGPQERGLRPGTETPVLLAGFGAAASFAHDEHAVRFAHCDGLRRQLLVGLRAIAGARVFGDTERSTGNTVLVGFPGCDGQLLLINLDLVGVAVSTGAACSSGTMAPSPVLLALGCTPQEARSAIRISVGKDTTRDEIDALLAALPGVVARVRGAAPGDHARRTGDALGDSG